MHKHTEDADMPWADADERAAARDELAQRGLYEHPKSVGRHAERCKRELLKELQEKNNEPTT